MRRAALFLIALITSLAAQAAPPLHASEVLGVPVVDARGAPLGRLDDVLFDARDGAVRVLILERGGWLGVNESFATFPRAALHAFRSGRLVLDAGAEPLVRAPALETPWWPRVSARMLMNREVVDRLHRDVGELRDLLIEPPLDRVSAAIVDRRDDWKPGEALIAVPIEAFSIPPDLGDHVTLNYSRERLN